MQDISDATLDAMESDTELQEQFTSAEHRFRALAADTHLPFLEVKVYAKYLLQTKTERSLSNLHHVIGVLTQHRTHTLRVLKVIHERENVVGALHTKSEEYAREKVSTLDAQSQVLRLLYCHQQATLKVAEAVETWRSVLTRPFPFNWKGVNYMTKVVDDAQIIDNGSLRGILPLRLTQFPLCSNIASLALFAADPASAALRPGHKPREASPQELARLRNAEGLLFEEATLQDKLHRELEGAAAAGYFVPLLNVQAVIPNCCTGIRVSNKEWSDQLSQAIARSRDGKPPAACNASLNSDNSVCTPRRSPSPQSSSRSSSRRISSRASSRASSAHESPVASQKDAINASSSNGSSKASSKASPKASSKASSKNTSPKSSRVSSKSPIGDEPTPEPPLASSSKNYDDDFGSSSDGSA